jgi:hypothetical protein
MVSTFAAFFALAIALFFAIEGFSGNTALNVLLAMAGLGALALFGASVFFGRRRPRG